jgi:hypothetical protein
MRRKLALSALGLGLGLSFLPVHQASAVCITTYYQLTGDCSPCITLARLGINPGNCVD